jgi:hypothetical protein
MGRIEERLEELGLSLPKAMTPPGSFQPVLVHAGLAYRSAPGQGPSRFNVPVIADPILAVERS